MAVLAARAATSGQEDGTHLTLETPSYRVGRARPRWLSVPLRFLVPALIVVGWWIGSATGAIPEEVLAGPPKVWTAFSELFETGQLIDFSIASFKRAALGVLFGVAVGLVLGILSGLSSLGEELIDSTMQINRAIPFLALVPLFIAWFGIDETFKVLLIAFATVGPMYAYTYLGVRNVDRKMVEAAQSFGLCGWRLVVGAILPSALPGILMALRICLSISITGLIAAEQIGTREGIGYLVTLAQEYNRTDYMVLCVVLYALLGLVFDGVVRIIERYSMPWRGQVAVR
ncbi:sulfonate transport system permease protein [Rhodococcus sp. 27YEA15]|uniref:ABC transporter permease n=1 Tax=Rhodococcus sp. 27YEA15 TaxID=3156259 RepID=UPI003C7CC3E0